MWGYERVLHVALVDGAVGLDNPEAIVEPLAQMMIGGVFGG
jgi:PleD family two-component response regulator